jgi:hypothetical protein
LKLDSTRLVLTVITILLFLVEFGFIVRKAFNCKRYIKKEGPVRFAPEPPVKNQVLLSRGEQMWIVGIRFLSPIRMSKYIDK